MTWVVGIAGGSGSGKTWLAEHLATTLAGEGASVIAHDAYYRPLPDALRATPWRHNFDEPAALETTLLVAHLQALRAGRPVDMPRYDFTHHTRTGTTPVRPGPVLLAEGILLLTDPRVRRQLDLAVFVDAPAPIRLARRVARDTITRGRDAAEVRARFEHHVQPMHEAWVEPTRAHADLVVDGTADIQDAIERVLARRPPPLLG